MEIVQFGLYNVLDLYFEDFKNSFFCDNKHENRPYYCAFTDSDGVSWLIPLSTQTKSYRAKICNDEKRQKDGKCLFYHIGIIAGIERAFLIGNMFPISKRYVKKEYTISGIHYVVKDKELIKEVHSRASKYLSLVKLGKLHPHIDILSIKQKLLEQETEAKKAVI